MGFAPTYTPRSRFRYKAAGVEHTITFRGARGATGADMNGEFKTFAAAIFTAAAVRLADDFEWLAHDIALTDSDLFAPAELPSPVTGLASVDDFTPALKIRGTTFSGRSAGGKARFTMFGLFWGMDLDAEKAKDFLVTPAEVAFIETIATNASGHVKAANGVQATFYQRATIKEYDRLVKHVRKGTIR